MIPSVRSHAEELCLQCPDQSCSQLVQASKGIADPILPGDREKEEGKRNPLRNETRRERERRDSWFSLSCSY